MRTPPRFLALRPNGCFSTRMLANFTPPDWSVGHEIKLTLPRNSPQNAAPAAGPARLFLPGFGWLRGMAAKMAAGHASAPRWPPVQSDCWAPASLARAPHEWVGFPWAHLSAELASLVTSALSCLPGLSQRQDGRLTHAKPTSAPRWPPDSRQAHLSAELASLVTPARSCLPGLSQRQDGRLTHAKPTSAPSWPPLSPQRSAACQACLSAKMAA
ncbi:uncharacterized protein LOC127036440 isoform X2 [Gopherus flavomarginatus]|uniref:uncharacterized protein LOC127036440 isoform X2 n=1 Tax=Gopherus flavomarginatus TaxID=286002 RepID=UPI0021CC1647|nr:uncharacterized protein LOC127036440 isoform X2 [Gopherus flavomarginatus]